MTQISVLDLATNTDKYVMMAQKQDIIITKSGRIVAKLTTASPDKKAAFEHLRELFNGLSISDEEAEAMREERLS